MKKTLMILCLVCLLGLGGCTGQPAEQASVPQGQGMQIAPAAPADKPVETADVQYDVTVVNSAGLPVPGVTLNVCDAASCRVLTTDGAGHASFTGEPYAYKVQALKVPEEYQAGAEIVLPPAGGSGTLVLTGK